MFQVATPLAANADAIGAAPRIDSNLLMKQPPWMVTATGNGPRPGGTRNSPTCRGSGPYASVKVGAVTGRERTSEGPKSRPNAAPMKPIVTSARTPETLFIELLPQTFTTMRCSIAGRF